MVKKLGWFSLILLSLAVAPAFIRIEIPNISPVVEAFGFAEVQSYPPTAAGIILDQPPIRAQELPKQIVYLKPGFVNPDGSVHSVHQPHPVTGKTLNVVAFGADPRDNRADDRPAVAQAMAAAAPGDELYFPNGVYNFNSVNPKDRTCQLRLKSGVNLRGQSENTAVLVSNLTPESNSTVLRVLGGHDLTISDLTVTSTFNGRFSQDPKTNNPDAGGPVNGIQIEDLGGAPSYNITINRVTVEKYQRIGVRISKSHDITVSDSTFQDATDVGGGGAGYGVALQGDGHERNRIGYQNDCRYNLVQGCNFSGPNLRHGTLIQYYAHNNLVQQNTYCNTVLDAIDLHGEDEYFNEIRHNQIQDIRGAAGIGVGNTGATHDRAGPFNYLHDNRMTNCREGIVIIMGSPNTLVENNTITGCTESGGTGVYLSDAPGTMVRGNQISNNRARKFWGIKLVRDLGEAPRNIQITGNAVFNNTNGLLIESGSGIVVSGNQVRDNLITNYQSKVPVSEQLAPFGF